LGSARTADLGFLGLLRLAAPHGQRARVERGGRSEAAEDADDIAGPRAVRPGDVDVLQHDCARGRAITDPRFPTDRGVRGAEHHSAARDGSEAGRVRVVVGRTDVLRMTAEHRSMLGPVSGIFAVYASRNDWYLGEARRQAHPIMARLGLVVLACSSSQVAPAVAYHGRRTFPVGGSDGTPRVACSSHRPRRARR